uniref:Uncharacterized protein n=1 Tax=Anguilla anguilla TaxID=7936 RepID=A0A0E9T7C2_ANGAN
MRKELIKMQIIFLKGEI